MAVWSLTVWLFPKIVKWKLNGTDPEVKECLSTLRCLWSSYSQRDLIWSSNCGLNRFGLFTRIHFCGVEWFDLFTEIHCCGVEWLISLRESTFVALSDLISPRESTFVALSALISSRESNLLSSTYHCDCACLQLWRLPCVICPAANIEIVPVAFTTRKPGDQSSPAALWWTTWSYEHESRIRGQKKRGGARSARDQREYIPYDLVPLLSTFIV